MTDHLPSSGAFTDPAVAQERYVCLDRIGSGGMGLVWRARDTRLDREVALKTVPERDEELEERLEREVKIATRLRSKGIVQILDRGRFPDGRPFLVMELLQTPALTGHDDLRVLAQAARAVGDAHRQGIVHRDLKPSNLALRHGSCVLLDWGLAKPVEDSAWNERVLGGPLTASGASVGTIGYMAPEQLVSGPATPAGDVWALGAMAYEVLTGRPPFDEASHHLLAQVSKGSLELPASPAAGVVRRALSLEPSQRFEDGHAFAEALEAALEPSAPATHARWSPIGWATGGLVVGALGVVLLNPTPRAARDGRGAPVSAEAVDAALLLQLGRALAEQGRSLEAREHGMRAEQLQTTAIGRGLLAVPPVPDAQVVEHDCDRVELIPGDGRILCSRPQGTTVLRDGATLARFPIGHDESWLVGDQLLSRRGWQLFSTDAAGLTQQLPHSWRGVLIVSAAAGTDGWVAAAGPYVRQSDDEGHIVRQAMAPESIEAVLPIGEQVVAGAEGHLYRLEEEGLESLSDLGEPVVTAGVAGGRAIFVGLRGQVVELDARTLAELGRYRLRHVAQVDDAAIAEGQVAVSTPHGVFVYRRGEPEVQLSARPADQLAFAGPDRLVAARGTTTWTHALEPVRHLLTPTRGSTSALRSGSNPGVASGRRVLVLEPTELGWGPTVHDSQDGIVRSLVFPDFRVDNRQAYRRRGSTFERLGTFPVMALLADGRAIGVRRWAPGFGVFDDENARLVEDTPPLLNVITDLDGSHGLAVSKGGALYRLGGDGTVEALGVEGVDEPLAAGPLGRVVTRGAQIEVLGAWTASCADRVRSLAVDERFVAVGTHSGEVCVFGADGSRLQQFRAHPERVSAMMIWGDWLFTGSWAPGIRRWNLPVHAGHDQSRNTTSSSG